jgi:hypothetical protein
MPKTVIAKAKPNQHRSIYVHNFPPAPVVSQDNDRRLQATLPSVRPTSATHSPYYAAIQRRKPQGRPAGTKRGIQYPWSKQ